MTSVGTTGPFLRSDRLLDSKDFRRVLRRGHRRAHRDVVVVSARRPEKSFSSDELRSFEGAGHPASRLGITASRKVGNAVVRNRFKRRIRAWFRARRSELPAHLDLVVIARKSGSRLSFWDLDARLSELLDLPPVDRTPTTDDPPDQRGNHVHRV